MMNYTGKERCEHAKWTIGERTAHRNNVPTAAKSFTRKKQSKVAAHAALHELNLNLNNMKARCCVSVEAELMININSHLTRYLIFFPDQGPHEVWS